MGFTSFQERVLLVWQRLFMRSEPLDFLVLGEVHQLYSLPGRLRPRHDGGNNGIQWKRCLRGSHWLPIKRY